MLIDMSSGKKTGLIKEKLLNVLISRSSEDLLGSIPWTSRCVHHTHATEIAYSANYRTAPIIEQKNTEKFHANIE